MEGVDPLRHLFALAHSISCSNSARVCSVCSKLSELHGFAQVMFITARIICNQEDKNRKRAQEELRKATLQYELMEMLHKPNPEFDPDKVLEFIAYIVHCTR